MKMSDIIQLLPETVANQIAAGEVIQRPASAVKELLENAVDAGSLHIELHIKDSGKSLIQITDDGSGMSPTDARLAFARHATSKIKSADDLFSIRTMGFRGEALASIAAISHVEIKTKRKGEEVGTFIEIEGNDIKKQQPVSTREGTVLSVKNLFYNVPARRNFLKSDSIEARHIIDEFERVAYAHPGISFSLNLNGVEIFRLPSSNLRQRIVTINGSNYNERLVPVSEKTTLLNIQGFVGKPEFCRKKRGEQFLFVNNRFVKDPYLNHAVASAFEDLLPKESFPSYWLYIDIDPSRIDVNIHPTKTEIKFEDDRSVYAIVRAAVKRSLGQYNVSPSLNFDHERTFDVPHSMRYQPVQSPGITVNTEFNPFTSKKSIETSGWQKKNYSLHPEQPVQSVELPVSIPSNDTETEEHCFQQGPYIVCKISEGILIIDASAAHERILYQRFLKRLQSGQPLTQQSLFPLSLTLSASDYLLVKEISHDLLTLGFDLQEFGKNTFAIQGIPVDIVKGKEKDILESIIEQYKHNASVLSTGASENLARSMARSIAIQKSSVLEPHDIKMIVREIRKTEKSDTGLDGKPCMILLKTGDLAEKFR
jgi:DNA mismatch repair protein MutL